MTGNSFGKIFRVTTWGESHGAALGCIVDGVPPNISIDEKYIQKFLNKRKPGQSKYTTQRKEDDIVEILSGVFNGKTTGTPICLLIRNKDTRSKDYSEIKDKFRPGHADYTYHQKYGFRDYRGGGRSSAREKSNIEFDWKRKQYSKCVIFFSFENIFGDIAHSDIIGDIANYHGSIKQLNQSN